MKERLIGRAVVIVCVHCVVFLGRRHLGLGVSWFLSPVGDSSKWIRCRDITGRSIGGDSHNYWWRRSSLPRLGSCCVHAYEALQVCRVDLARLPSFLHPPEGIQSGGCWLWLFWVPLGGDDTYCRSFLYCLFCFHLVSVFMARDWTSFIVT